MVEKNGLDKYTCYTDLMEQEEVKESKQKRKIKQKVRNFNENAPKCENFMTKDGEIRSKIYWCKLINKSCLFINCPKKKK